MRSGDLRENSQRKDNDGQPNPNASSGGEHSSLLQCVLWVQIISVTVNSVRGKSTESTPLKVSLVAGHSNMRATSKTVHRKANRPFSKPQFKTEKKNDLKLHEECGWIRVYAER